MNVIIEEIVSEFPVLITEEVVKIQISDLTSYFDLLEVKDTDFVDKDGYVPTVNEDTGKIVLRQPTGGIGGSPSGTAGGDLGGTYPNPSVPGLANKVDKVTGKSLIDDSEITRLSTVTNFDNSENITVLGNKVDKVIGKGLSTEDYSTTEKNKLAAIASGATANDTDANLKNRANHTGSQLANTISDFAAAVALLITNKVDKITGYSLTKNDFTDILKTKLDGIADGAEVNVNADWNATTGDSQILNKPTIPSISGLELQANKQNSLATDGTGVKYPTVDAVNSGLVNVNTNAIDRITVKLSQDINKGQAVYIISANGSNIIVSKSTNATEAGSSKTLGLLETSGTTNAIVNVITDGLLDGIDTSTATIGDAVWLGTSGNLIFGLANKPVAPAHLVYIGVVSRVSATVGEIIVKVQNGFELNEIHDILITSVADKQLLSYNSATSLWKNKSVTTADIASSTNKNYVTDTQQTVITNTSGTNTGDNATNSQYSGLAASKEDTANKSTNTADSASTIKFPVWSAILSYFDAARIRTLLGITTLSGSNTGDQDLSSLAPKASPTFTGTVNGITKSMVGLGNVDNTSDVNKPVSTAQQTALDTRIKIIDKTSTPSSTLTGTLTETQVYSLTIPANTFTANDALILRDLYLTKAVSTATVIVRVKLSTSATMPSTTTDQIATLNFAAASTYAKIKRSYAINGGTISGYTFLGSANDDVVNTASVFGSASFNPAVTNYLYVSLTLGNILDSVTFKGLAITN